MGKLNITDRAFSSEIIDSPVQICNLALNKIKQATIESLDEDSLQAERCRLLYNHVRRYLLYQYNWTFAIEQATLSIAKYKKNDKDPSLVDESLFEYNYKYSLPNNFLRLINVYSLSDSYPVTAVTEAKPPYVIEGKYLLCDYPKVSDPSKIRHDQLIKIKYIKDITNVSRWTPGFTQVVVYALASELTQVFNDSAAYEQQIEAKLDYLLKLAKTQDAQQTQMQQMNTYPLLNQTLLF